MKKIKIRQLNLSQFFQTKRGITLIELLIGIIIVVILSLTVGTVLLYTSSMYKNTVKKLNLEKEAHYVIMKIEKDLREKSPDEIEIGENGEKLILNKNNENSSYFQKVNNDLIYFDGNQIKTLIKNKVTLFKCERYQQDSEVKNNLLKITLSLSDEKFTYNIETSVKLRNG